MTDLNFCPVERDELMHDLKTIDQDDSVDWDYIYKRADELEKEFLTNPNFYYVAGCPLHDWTRDTFREDFENTAGFEILFERGVKIWDGKNKQQLIDCFFRMWIEDLAENIYCGLVV